MERTRPYFGVLHSFFVYSLCFYLSLPPFITLQADYFISKASIMNNVNFLSSFFFFLGRFARCDLAFGPVADWWAIFGAQTTAGGMRNQGLRSKK